jgi:hypothetical protein
MIYMCRELEKMNRKTFNCFPIRTSTVPSNITIDTLSLITLFVNTEGRAISKILKDNISILHDKIWEMLFNLDSKQFKYNNRYKFNHTIDTDGVSVTILFVHKHLDNVDIHKSRCKKDNFKYIDDLGKLDNNTRDKELMMKEINKMREKYKFVYVDPGKNPDLLYMGDDDGNYFKYTTKQRIHEMETIKNRKIIERFKKQNEEIIKAEESLQNVPSKTCMFNETLNYVKEKHKQNQILQKYYGLEFLRKMRLRSYINKLRSESKLVNNITNTFKTDKREIMLIYGDWSRLSQMRGCISTPNIGLKRRLSMNFKIMNFDEFRTSCLDSITLKENENAKVNKDGKIRNVKDDDKTKKLH